MQWWLQGKGKLLISRSGRTPWEQVREESRKKLYELAALGLLPDDIVAEAMQVLATKETAAKKQEYYVLIEQLVADKLRPADFIVQWMRVTEPQRNWLPFGLVLLPLVIGALLYFSGDGKQESSASSVLDDKEPVITAATPVALPAPTTPKKVPFTTIPPLTEKSAKQAVVVIDNPEVKRTPVVIKSTGPQPKEIMTESTTGTELVYIPEGCFQMGSSPEEKDRDSDEGPVHKVCLDAFWMGKYEVTNDEYVQFLNDVGKRGTEKRPWFETEKEDSRSKIQGKVGKFKVKLGYERHPVNNVSWYGAVAYIDWLNQETETGKKYRLPTEAEWEYAARAGTKTARHWGDDISCDKAMYDNYSATDNCAEYVRKKGFENGSTAPVGSYSKNQFDLHDMLGNVYEWCADWYDKEYYVESKKQGGINNPGGALTGSNRVIRGGGWYFNPRNVRSAFRSGYTPGYRSNGLGFRLALPAQQDK